MAVVKNLVVRAGADFSSITKESQKASSALKGMSVTASGSGARINASLGKVKIGLLAAAAAITAVVGYSKDAMQAYELQAEAEAKLAQAMRNRMNASAADIKAVLELASAQQALGIVGDEVQLAGAAKMASYVKERQSLEKLIPVMNDMVAANYGYDATQEQAAQTAQLFGKVLAGQTGALTRYGFAISDADKKIFEMGTEEQRVAALTRIVEERVGGMNAALANTNTGRMKQLSNTLGDIKEQFGAAATQIAIVFLPVLQKLASILADVATVAQRVAQTIANVFGAKATAASFSYAAPAIEDTADGLDDVSSSADGAADSVKEVRRQLMGFDQLNILDNSADSGSGSGGGVKGAAAAAADTASGLSSALTETGPAVESIGWLEDLLTGAKKLFDELGDAAKLAGKRIEDGTLLPYAAAVGLYGIIDAICKLVGVGLPAAAAVGTGALLGEGALTGALLGTGAAAEYAIPLLGAGGSTGVAGALTGVSTAAGITTAALIGGVVAGLAMVVGGTISGVKAFDEYVDSMTGTSETSDEAKQKVEELTEKLAKEEEELKKLSDSGADLSMQQTNVDATKIALSKATKEYTRLLEEEGKTTDDAGKKLDELAQKADKDSKQMRDSFTGSVDDMKRSLSSGGWSIPHIPLPHFSLSGSFSLNPLSVPHISVNWYANGGFPDAGSLFFAGEKGPELVGTMGGKTAVANNEQIVQAVSSGVFQAVSSALMNMKTQGGGTTVWNINGREFFRATYEDMQAVQKEHGISMIKT